MKRIKSGNYLIVGFLLVLFVVFDVLQAHRHATTNPSMPTASQTKPTQTSKAITSPVPGIDLTNWYLTLPVSCSQVQSAGCKGDPSGPGEIFQPVLKSFTDSYFNVDNSNQALIFRADVNGVTTSGSEYSRSELREMINNGTTHASWSTANGISTMVVTQAVEHLPIAKPQVVTAQIHNDSGEVVEVLAKAMRPGPPTKYSQYRICVRFGPNQGKETGPCLDTHYLLGQFYTINITARAGVIRIWYAKGATAPNTALPPTWQEPYVGVDNYFKTGVYTQSNLKTGDKAGAYGEVEISKLAVTHQ